MKTKQVKIIIEGQFETEIEYDNQEEFLEKKDELECYIMDQLERIEDTDGNSMMDWYLCIDNEDETEED